MRLKWPGKKSGNINAFCGTYTMKTQESMKTNIRNSYSVYKKKKINKKIKKNQQKKHSKKKKKKNPVSLTVLKLVWLFKTILSKGRSGRLLTQTKLEKQTFKLDNLIRKYISIRIMCAF